MSAPSAPPSEPPSPRWTWALGGALASAILLGAGVLIGGRTEPPPIVVHPPPTPVVPSPTPPPTPAPLVIYVSGAVVSPGLYTLPGGARVGHALEAAGGLLPDADSAAVNQATLLWDGAQVHVPVLGAAPGGPPPGASGSSGAGAPSSGGAPAAGKINVNTASAAELESLPGIGPALVAAIIANRPYATVEELDRVPGIGPAKLADLRDLVAVQ